MASATSPPAIPPTMRAWTRGGRGPVRTHLHLRDIPTPAAPEATSSDVLIRVARVALNFSSEMVMETIPAFLTGGNGGIPELEVAGTVAAAGGAAPAELAVGTSVAGFASIPDVFMRGRGVLAEYVRLSAGQVVVRAPEIPIDQAAGITGAGTTSLKMIRKAPVRSGMRVLVNGASGSVGTVLVQMCKNMGVYVVAVASGRNEELVRGLGVDEFVDYTAHESLPKFLASEYRTRPFDHVLDCVGVQALYTNSPGYLKPEGSVVNIGALEGAWRTLGFGILNSIWPAWLGGTPRRYMMFSTPPWREGQVELLRLLREGKVKMIIDSVWNMEDVKEAYAKLATQRARGKIIIRVSDD